MEKQKLTRSEEYALEMIEKDSNFFISNNLKTLSKKYNVGEATLIRMINKLGHTSLKDMQIKYASKINLNKLMDIQPFSNVENITNNIVSFELYSILETKELIELDQLDKLSQIIISSNQIALFGVENSHISASYFANSLSRIGYNATAWQSLHGAFSAINFMDPEKDLVIIYSSNGKTKEALSIAEHAFKHNIKIAWIASIDSKDVDSILQKSEFKLFHAYHKNDNLKFPSITSSSGQIFISNILFNIILNSSENNIKHLLDVNDAIKDWNK